MADEENKNEQAEEKAPEAEAAEERAEEKAPEAEAPEEQPEAAEEPPAEDAAEPAAEAPAEDAPAEEAPAEDAPAEDAPAEEAPAADGGEDELEGMEWKARRRLERSRESGEAGPQRSPEDRQADRDQRRAAAAKRRASYRPRGRKRRKGAGEGTPPAERDSVARKVRQGTVVSNKADKTITVQIDIVRRHPTYEKIVRRTSTLHAHDERNEANTGDVVKLVETRPLSKSKRWRLTEIVEKAK
jgi:small subunit ribosomal protein S17